MLTNSGKRWLMISGQRTDHSSWLTLCSSTWRHFQALHHFHFSDEILEACSEGLGTRLQRDLKKSDVYWNNELSVRYSIQTAWCSIYTASPVLICTLEVHAQAGEREDVCIQWVECVWRICIWKESSVEREGVYSHSPQAGRGAAAPLYSIKGGGGAALPQPTWYLFRVLQSVKAVTKIN